MKAIPLYVVIGFNMLSANILAQTIDITGSHRPTRKFKNSGNKTSMANSILVISILSSGISLRIRIMLDPQGIVRMWNTFQGF
jgi:hypothetical protein